jgi:hypothetical protein
MQANADLPVDPAGRDQESVEAPMDPARASKQRVAARSRLLAAKWQPFPALVGTDGIAIGASQNAAGGVDHSDSRGVHPLGRATTAYDAASDVDQSIDAPASGSFGQHKRQKGIVTATRCRSSVRKLTAVVTRQAQQRSQWNMPSYCFGRLRAIRRRCPGGRSAILRTGLRITTK